MVFTPSPLLSIGSILTSMTFSSVGTGLMATYVPFTLSQEGIPAWIAGAAVTAIAAGGIFGCLLAGPLIRRVGHARMYACFAAMIIISAAIIGLGLWPNAWIFSRFLYGLAANGLFIVTQSWLNHSSDNSWRGRAMSVFYAFFIIGMGFGSFLFGQLPDNGARAPVVAILFFASGIVPIGLTRLPNPPPPDKVEIDLRKTWQTSPVGLIGIFASGGLSMLVQGFTPIYASKGGFSQSEVATLMFVMQIGMLFVQLPLGALSDRIDRRLVLAGVCLAIVLLAFTASLTPLSGIIWIAIIFALWSGATETIYSVANAHANDRADPEDYVPLASTMLVAWSAAAFVVPAIVTAMTPVYGPKTFMFAAMVLALMTAAFVAYRVTKRRPVPEHQAENFELRSAQIANAEVLLNPDETATEIEIKPPH